MHSTSLLPRRLSIGVGFWVKGKDEQIVYVFSKHVTITEAKKFTARIRSVADGSRVLVKVHTSNDLRRVILMSRLVFEQKDLEFNYIIFEEGMVEKQLWKSTHRSSNHDK